MIEDIKKDYICRYYDRVLSKEVPVGVILHGSMSPSLINFCNYDDKTTANHLANIFRISNEIIKYYPILSKSEVIDYIKKPDFKVQTDVYNSSLSQGCNSLENALLYRFMYEQVLVEPLQKRPCRDFKAKEKVIPLTKITRIDLGNDLFYYKEDIIFLHDRVFNAMYDLFLNNYLDKKNFINENDNFEQKALIDLWDKFVSMGYEVYRMVKPNTYIRKNLFHEEFLKRHTCDFDENNFVFIKKMAFDNRKHDMKIDPENGGKVLSLAYQKMNF